LYLKGSAKLELLNPVSEEIITEIKISPIKTEWELSEGNKNTFVSWQIELPKNLFSKYQMLMYRIYAWTDDEKFTDAEQSLIPVKLNRTYLVETYPITIIKDGKYSYDLKRFHEIMNSSTADVSAYTIELLMQFHYP